MCSKGQKIKKRYFAKPPSLLKILLQLKYANNNNNALLSDNENGDYKLLFFQRTFYLGLNIIRCSVKKCNFFSQNYFVFGDFI